MSRAEEQGFKKGKIVGLEKGKAQGFRDGKAQGLEKGKVQGFRKGKAEGKAAAVDQMRQMVLRRIEKRFGPVPEPVEARFRAISSIEALARLLEKLSSAQSVDDLLPHRNGNGRAKNTD